MSTLVQLAHAAYEQPVLDAPEDGSRAGAIVVTVGAYTLFLVVSGLAVQHALRGSYVGLGCLVGALVLSWGEAVYDSVFHLTFYTDDMTLWSPFGIDQPLWVPPGYVMAYGLGGWLVAQRLLRGGVTRRQITKFLALAWIGCSAFETFAYRIGAFEYYAHDITLWGMPYWHEMFNAVFIVIAGILIAAVQPLMRNANLFTHLAMPTLVYMAGFTGVTYGAGYLALDVHNSSMGEGWMYLAATASNLAAVLMLWAMVDLLELLPGYEHSLATGPRMLKLSHRGRAPLSRPL